MLRLHRNARIKDGVLALDQDGQIRTLHFGVTLPALGGGWDIEGALSFSDGIFLLLLVQDTQRAVWLCDADNRLISGDGAHIATHLEALMAETEVIEDRTRLAEILVVCYLNAGKPAQAFKALAPDGAIGIVYGAGILPVVAQIAFDLGRTNDLTALFDRSSSPPHVKTAILQTYLGPSGR